MASAILGIAGVAQADPAAEARFHDEQARSHYAQGNYEKAVREFLLEQRAAPNPRIVFNIALCFQQLKRDEDAHHYFREYLDSSDPDEARRTRAEQALSVLDAKVARLLVESSVPGADVYVDQREYGSYGKTPRVVALAAGEHQIWIELAGHRTATTKVTARLGEQVRVRLEPERIVGQLQVLSSASGTARVTTASGDVVAEGATPLATSLPPGTYRISVTASGHLPWHDVASVGADRAVEVEALPLQSPKPSSDITVTSNVPGALVELDGQPIGFTPTVLAGVPIGPHRLTTKAGRLLPWSGAVQVDAGRRAWVTVTLEQPAQVRRSLATWVVGGLGLATLGASGVLGVLAAQAHSDFESQSPNVDRSALRERGVALNTATDVLLVSSLIALGTAGVLYFTTSETRGRASSASVTSQDR